MNDNDIKKKVGTRFSPNDMKVKCVFIPYLFVILHSPSSYRTPSYNVCTIQLCTKKWKTI